MKELTENALIVLRKRYLRKDKNGEVIETPEQLFRRVACNIAKAETNYGSEQDAIEWEEEFFKIMSELKFLPNSPTLMNAGRECQMLSACFVVPIPDTMEGILRANMIIGMIHKWGGGTGMSWSRLRPRNATVDKTQGVSSGLVSFMKIVDATTETVKQGGTRRGANMAILRVDHPDIEEFIICKADGKSFQNFNISVAITDDFMRAVEAELDYDLIDPHTNAKVGIRNARKIFDLIIKNAWETGDPGAFFIDTANAANPTPDLGSFESTNPCGEINLLPYESCNLGSINLAQFIKDGEINFEDLETSVAIGIRFLDDVIDANQFPIPEIAEATYKTRKIGLGVMGFADMLAQLKVPYNSPEGFKTADTVMGFIRAIANKTSEELASERGSFPAYKKELHGTERRNATVLTAAPTGTLSIIANCSSGIEPLFGVVFEKHILDESILNEINPYFRKLCEEKDLKVDYKKIAKIGSIQNLAEIPDDAKMIFRTALDIHYKDHVKMQAIFQRHIDNSVSKTINLPFEATIEDVANIYLHAWRLKCKGITVYRNGCRDKQVLNFKKEEPKAESKKVDKIIPRGRNRKVSGDTVKVRTPCGTLYLTINKDENGLCEVFSGMGKAGGCSRVLLEAISRLISIGLRSGLDPAQIVRQLRGLQCPTPFFDSGNEFLSCPDAIAAEIGEQLGADKKNFDKHENLSSIQKMCPECSNKMELSGGCFTCRVCGYSKCS